jgi:hypothetical protein
MKHFLLKNKLTICGAGAGNNNNSQANPPAIISQYPSVITPPGAGGLNSITSFSYAEVIDLLSDGPIEGLVNPNGIKLYDENIFEGIYLDDTQIKQSSNLIFQNFDISSVSSQLKTIWNTQKKFTGTYSKIIDINSLTGTDNLRFTDKVQIKLFDPSSSLLNFFNETNSDLNYKNSIQRAFDTSPISTQKLFLTEIIFNRIELDIDKTIFDLSEGAVSSDDYPLKLQIPNFGDYIYYTISADNLNQFNYFELPRSFVLNNAISKNGKKTFIKSIKDKYNDAKTYWTYEVFNLKILIWSIYDVSNGILDFSKAVDKYLSTLTVSQNNGSLYNFNLINAEFKNGSEYQLPLKNFNTVDIDTVYNKELVGPFKISNKVISSDCGSFIAGGVQRLCSIQYFSNISPPVNVSLADETSDDIRYIKSWAVESDINANPYLLCCLYSNYAVFDCTSANRSCQDAIPITHYIANQNVECVYVSLVLNQLSDTAAVDMSALNPGLNSSKSQNSTLVPFGTPTYATLINSYSDSSNGVTATGYFLIYGSSYNNGYVLDSNTGISQLASNLSAVTNTSNQLYLQTLGANGLQSVLPSIDLKQNITTNTYNATLQNGLINFMLPNSTCLINTSFKINDYVSDLGSLQNRLQSLNDDGSLTYCFGLNEKESLVKASGLIDCSLNTSISTTLSNFNSTLTNLGSPNKFYVASYLYNTYDIRISTNQSNLKSTLLLAVNISPFIDFSLIFSNYNSVNYSLPINSLNLKFDENKYPNIKKYIVDTFLSNSNLFVIQDGYYVFTNIKPPESYLPKLLLLGITYNTLLTNNAYINAQSVKFQNSTSNSINYNALDFIEYNLSNYLLRFTNASYYKNFSNCKPEYSHLLTDSLSCSISTFKNNNLLNITTLLADRTNIYCLTLTQVSNVGYYTTNLSINPNLFSDANKTAYDTQKVTYVCNTYYLNKIQSNISTVCSNADYVISVGSVVNYSSNNLNTLDNSNVGYCYSKSNSAGGAPTVSSCDFSSCTVDITAGTKLPAIVSVRVETGYDSYDGETYTGPCEYFSYKFDIFGISASQSILDLGRNNYDYVYQQKESIDIGGYYTSSRPSYLQLPNISSASVANTDAALSQIISATQATTKIVKFWTLKNTYTGQVIFIFNCVSSGSVLPSELSKDINNINLACFITDKNLNFDGTASFATAVKDVRRKVFTWNLVNTFDTDGSSSTPLDYYFDNQNGLNLNNYDLLYTYSGGAWDDFWNRPYTDKISMRNGSIYSDLCLNGFQDPGNSWTGSKACSYNHLYSYGPYDAGMPASIKVRVGASATFRSTFTPGGVSGGPRIIVKPSFSDKFGAQLYIRYNKYNLCQNSISTLENYSITHTDPLSKNTQCLYWHGFTSKTASNAEILKCFVSTLKAKNYIDKSITFANFNINPSLKFSLAGSKDLNALNYSDTFTMDIYVAYTFGGWIPYVNLFPKGDLDFLVTQNNLEVGYWQVPLTNQFALDSRKLQDLYSNLYGTNKDLTIQMPPPKYDSFGNPIKRYVRVTKLSHETMSPLISKQIALNKITEIIPHKFSYPFSSITGLKIDSRAFSQVPVRNYLVKLKKVLVPSNYFPISPKSNVNNKSEVDVRYIKDFSGNYKLYDGDWDGLFKLAWTDNPAWVLMDLLVNKRYGLGNFISSDQIDIWELYKIARWCDHVSDDGTFIGVSDGKNGIQPRHSFNALINQKFNLFDLINQVASIFHGRVYYANSLITFDDDRPKPAIGEFSNSDVKDGSFNYTNIKKSDQFTSVKISYVDSDDNFKPKSEYVEDQEGIRKRGIMMKEINAFGINSKAQAIRFARNFLYQTSSENRNVTFVTDSRALLYRPGDLIRINDSLINKIRNYGTIKRVTDIDDDSFEIVIDQLIDSTLMLSNEINLFTPINKPNADFFNYKTKNAPLSLEINNLNYFSPKANYIENNKNLTACVADGQILCASDFLTANGIKNYTGIITYSYYQTAADLTVNNKYKDVLYNATLCYSDYDKTWNLNLNSGCLFFNFDSKLDPQLKYNLQDKEYFFNYIDTGYVTCQDGSNLSTSAISPSCYSFNKKTINVLQTSSSSKLSYYDIIESDRPSVETFRICSSSIVTGAVTGANNDVMGCYSIFCVFKDNKASINSGIGNICVGTPYSLTLYDTCEKLFKIMSISENYINEYNIIANQYDICKFNYIEAAVAKDDLESTFNQLYNYNSPSNVDDQNAIKPPQILSLERSSDLQSINLTFYKSIGATKYSIYVQTPSKQTKNFTQDLNDADYNSNTITYSFPLSAKEVGTYIFSIASVSQNSVDTTLVKYSNTNQRSITIVSY